jgi:energy-coupling factor transport system substrate-specific component
VVVNLLGQATMLGLAVLLREVLILAGLSAWIAGAAAHALGIAAGAIVNYLGHRHVTFTRTAGS